MPKEITGTYLAPRIAGWRYYPDAKGKEPFCHSQILQSRRDTSQAAYSRGRLSSSVEFGMPISLRLERPILGGLSKRHSNLPFS